MITNISVKKALELPNKILIDTRSPSEYNNDHIEGAINLPLLDDQERHEVGLIYKQISREKAIEKGMEFYAPKIPTIHEAVKNHRDKNIVVYCARGGMRSGIIANLLDSIGFTVFKIEYGYKGFRNYMIKKLDKYTLKPKVIVLYGLTCTGKTEILQKLPNSIDLEGLAQHRGSLMGALGMQPHSQKKFENLLLKRLNELQDEDVIFVEGESRRIGDIIIPPFLWKAMCHGKKVLITRSIEKRTQAMVDEYFGHATEIKSIVGEFARVISKKNKLKIQQHIENKEYNDAARLILTEYYDPLYKHTLNQMEYSEEINADDVEEAVDTISNQNNY